MCACINACALHGSRQQGVGAPRPAVMSRHEPPNVGAGTQTWILWEAVSALGQRVISPALKKIYFYKNMLSFNKQNCKQKAESKLGSMCQL